MPTASKSSDTSTQGRKSSRSAPNAIDLLTADHKEVKKRFRAYEKLAQAGSPAEERQALATEICDMLSVHAQIEEEIFYPAAREALDDQDLVDEAAVEHQTAKDLIAQIRAMTPDDGLYNAKVRVLGEYIDHHVQEEENELFPKTRRRVDIKEIGALLLQRKSDLMNTN